MKLVSVTIANEAAAPIIGDALRSVVGLVDECFVIHTDHGVALDEACVAVDGIILSSTYTPWTEDFSAARNFALEQASGDWAIRIDSDERLIVTGDIRAQLEALPSDVDFAYALHELGSHRSATFFRLPATKRYVGRTHEAFQGTGREPTLTGVRISELPKSPEMLKAKGLRDLCLLEAQIADAPNEARWWYYLGQTLQDLSRHEQAIGAYRTCVRMNGWDEEAAWACFKAAECLCILKRPAEAVEVCALGLSKHAGFGELAWLAGYANFWEGRYEQAILWSEVAIGLNRSGAKRIGFSYPEAQFEKPLEVLAYASRKLGLVEEADLADKAAVLAREARLSLSLRLP